MKQTIAISVAVLVLLGSGFWLVKSNSQVRVDPKITEFNVRANGGDVSESAF